MTMTDIMIVLFYSAKPYWWLALLAIILLIVSFYVGKKTFKLSSSTAINISVLVGIFGGLAAPYITGSQLNYVSTMTDWFALFAIMIAAGVYCYINLKLIRRTS